VLPKLVNAQSAVVVSHGFLLASQKLLVSQLSPVMPAGQLHTYCVKPATHVPPFAHGLLAQGSGRLHLASATGSAQHRVEMSLVFASIDANVAQNGTPPFGTLRAVGLPKATQ